jgi:hypothetical protein
MHENSSINESLLVQNLSKGNLNAFNYLYHKYSRSLYHFAYRYFKSEEEAEELVQVGEIDPELVTVPGIMVDAIVRVGA